MRLTANSGFEFYRPLNSEFVSEHSEICTPRAITHRHFNSSTRSKSSEYLVSFCATFNRQDFYTHRINATRKEYDKIKDRLKALTYERLDGRITTDLFDEIVNELTSRQLELDEQLMTLTHSNKGFLVTLSYLIDLSQRSPELFKNARPRLQQKMLKLVLSNIELNDKILSYTVNDPYKTFLETNKKAPLEPKSSNWCG